MTIAPAMRTAWRHNLEVNRVLVGHLTPAMLDARTPGGSYTVAEHLAHIVGVTRLFGARLDPERMRPLPTLSADTPRPP